MSKFIALWLEAPLQSWGHDSKFYRRETLDFPTRSGITGMILAAMGEFDAQEDLLADLASGKLTVLSYGKASEKMQDFHMVGTSYDSSDPWESLMSPKTSEKKNPVGSGAKITYRSYLQDTKFAAILEVSDSLASKVVEGLEVPVAGLWCGRKNCVPTEIVYRGCFNSEIEAEAVLQDIAAYKNIGESFRVVEGDGDGSRMTLMDVPVRFGSNKKYRDRRVTVIQAA